MGSDPTWDYFNDPKRGKARREAALNAEESADQVTREAASDLAARDTANKEVHRAIAGECDVCHEPGNDQEGDLMVAFGTAPSGPGPRPLFVHEGCRQYVLVAGRADLKAWGAANGVVVGPPIGD